MAFRVPFLCLFALAFVGCGSGPVVASHARVEGTEGGEDVLSGLREENATLTSRVETLEARLLAIEVQNDELRTMLDRAARTESARADTVRIGDGPRGPREEPELDLHADVDLEEEAPEREARGSRPVLTLHGPPVVAMPSAERPALAATGATLAGPPAPATALPPPVGTLGRLLVTGSPSDVPAIPLEPVTVLAAPTPEPDRAAAEYQSALRLLSSRDLSGALSALEHFAASHPDHPYADNAHYFRGEIYYAQHDYRAAIAELELLVARYPSAGRVADALLRIGTCWERLGDSSRAAHYFLRVRTEHPDSSAARMAEREDT